MTAAPPGHLIRRYRPRTPQLPRSHSWLSWNDWFSASLDDQGKSNVTGGFVVETTDNGSDEGSSLSPSMADDPVYVVWVEGRLRCLGCSYAGLGAEVDAGPRR